MWSHLNIFLSQIAALYLHIIWNLTFVCLFFLFFFFYIYLFIYLYIYLFLFLFRSFLLSPPINVLHAASRAATRGLTPANHFNKWHLFVSKKIPGGHGTAVSWFALNSILTTSRKWKDRCVLGSQLPPHPLPKKGNIKSTGTGEDNCSSVLGKWRRLGEVETHLYLLFSRVSVPFVLLTARSHSCVKYVVSKRDETRDVWSFQWAHMNESRAVFTQLFLFHFASVHRWAEWVLTGVSYWQFAWAAYLVFQAVEKCGYLVIL